MYLTVPFPEGVSGSVPVVERITVVIIIIEDVGRIALYSLAHNYNFTVLSAFSVPPQNFDFVCFM